MSMSRVNGTSNTGVIDLNSGSPVPSCAPADLTDWVSSFTIPLLK